MWRIVADDGHPVTGEFAFVVDLPPAPAESADALAAQVDSADAGRDTVVAPLEWETAGSEEASVGPSRGVVGTLRALAVGTLLALAGVLAFVAWWAPVPVPGARRLGIASVLPVRRSTQ
jgi:hypothetical protein